MTAMDPDAYLDAPSLDQMVGAFDTLYNDLWSENLEGTFWISGNVLHSAVNFILAGHAADASWLQGKDSRLGAIQTMIVDAYNYHQKTYEGSGYWYDDQTYWGIALLRIYENFSTLSGGSETISNGSVTIDAQDCLFASLDSWRYVQKAWNARVLEAEDAPVPGGCWNYYNDDYGVVQNTVTNCMYLVLSIRLYQALVGLGESSVPQGTVFTDIVAQRALSFACKIFYWLRSWMYLDKSDGEVLINDLSNNPVKNKDGEPLWLAHDGLFPKPSDSLQAVAALEQSVLMEGMLQMLGHVDAVTDCFASPELQTYTMTSSDGVRTAYDNFEADAKAIVANLDRGARQLIFHNQGTDAEPQFVLQDWPFQLLYNHGFGLDESTSKGIFMRYWAVAVPNMPRLLGAQAGSVEQAQAYIKQTAAAVWNKGSNGELNPNWANKTGRSGFIDAFKKAWAVTDVYASTYTEYVSKNQGFVAGGTGMGNFVAQSIGLDALAAYMYQLKSA